MPNKVQGQREIAVEYIGAIDQKQMQQDRALARTGSRSKSWSSAYIADSTFCLSVMRATVLVIRGEW